MAKQQTTKEMAARRATLRPHPVRDQIVDVMRSYGKPISPTQLSRITGGTLGSVAYHVRTLAEAGVIVLADEGRVRGAIEHLYTLALGDDDLTLTDPSVLLLSICGALTVPSKERNAYPRPVVLDDYAREQLQKLVGSLTPQVLAIATASTERAAA